MTADVRVAIDRGGTFCDVIAHVDGREPLIFKLLSEDPANYPDAPTEAVRRVLEAVEARPIPVGDKLDGSRIASCRIGTTVATNALLEHKGERFAFLTTKGFKDVCVIGDQSRPKLFDLDIRKPRALHSTVVEIDERIAPADYDLNPSPLDKDALARAGDDDDDDDDVVRTSSGDFVRIIRRPDADVVRAQLRALRDDGFTSLAICFMHAYLHPAHEALVAAVAREAEFAFDFVTTSAATSPTIKFLDRSTSTCSEAYLYPVVRRYVQSFRSGFRVPPRRVDFMCSDGGLKAAGRFRGNEALLSGPAGGVVGIARSCFDAGDGTPVIGFDMGGTSTDVSRYDGKYDYLTETSIAGRTITVPMLNIATVAAGGGSVLSARNGLLAVGPESAGAHPGPACYRKGGPLTVTDANLFLGRLVPSSFPSIFGPDADEPLDPGVVRAKFDAMTADLNAQTTRALSSEELALGFLDVANETMSRPIRNATEARGFAPERHHLVSFGGAGGQHACDIADRLGIRRILVHKYSSLLSAYGIAQAELQHEALEPYGSKLDAAAERHVAERLASLKARVSDELLSQSADGGSLVFDESLVLRYFGTDTNLAISRPEDGDYAARFEATHLREFAFSMRRDIVIESIRVRGTGSAGAREQEVSALEELNANEQHPAPESQVKQPVYVNGAWRQTPVHDLTAASKQTYITGPALLIDKTQTIYVSPTFTAHVLSSHILLQKQSSSMATATPVTPRTSSLADTSSVDPIQLSVFAHRFMAIAEQMGTTLQRTSISTSIKERLDFSCAVFSPEGKLVANAPHIPIHLGSMQFAIQAQHRLWRGRLRPGDVLLTNHPQWGGTHLPDLTVVTPVFISRTENQEEQPEIAFYVASRGHHTDIGGKGITSMMPESRELWEEGLSVPSLKLVSGGTFLEADVVAAFERAGSRPGCSTSRRLADNISDLKAQVSANQRGAALLGKLCAEAAGGLAAVHRYILAVQANAEAAVRAFFATVGSSAAGVPLEATDYLDDGTPMRVRITLDRATGSAVFDFSGSGPQQWGNYNCPVAVCHSAIIYAVRCLVGLEMPLNEGCLAPVEMIVPEGSVLNPGPRAATCGSTLASQRGCANSLGWGMGGRDAVTGEVVEGWNYGESIGGGVGAGEGYEGEHSTHVHSTNTRQTDAEVIEKRTAVLVRMYGIRRGSGGEGRWKGGDGITREIEARIPLKFSILSDRRVYRPYGMGGGGPGARGENYAFLFNEDGGYEKINLGGKAVINLKEGEYIQVNTPGGGGFGGDEVEDRHRGYV
ncbi:Uncharacterized protein Cob_v002374 [Colletotrichum orbiculare MAFF 240422]|uniref:5-oxoprolinase n=1 Tax=Colletotrichum orbiculare (strain 104-T / ATCC 96160 / CBS 514.97 / LARS 414 / MAFF 240422) TaxID=1213857 RepID=A0A484G5J5_COLOR|nr:Uncharacterized protein Cob_v002374 [Colletotrichum orbiculare MAFF 240422]